MSDIEYSNSSEKYRSEEIPEEKEENGSIGKSNAKTKDKRSRSRSPRKMSNSKTRYRSRSRSPRRRSRRSRSRSRSQSHSPMSSRRRHNGDREHPQANRCLGIFGLSIHTTEQELHHLMSKYGPVERIQVVIDAKTGRSRGFAFCYFESVEDAKAAKDQCNEMEFDGRRIRVDFSITQRAHTPTPGIYMGKPTRRDDHYSGGGGGGRGGGGWGRDRYDDYGYRGYRRSPSPYYSGRRRRNYERSRSRSYSPRRR